LRGGGVGWFLGIAGEGERGGGGQPVSVVCGLRVKNEVILCWSVLGVDRGSLLSIMMRLVGGVGGPMFVGTGGFGA
jgi:hypothetical protein